MYRITDKSAAIAEIQRLLNITQTKIHDKNTTNTVAEHQRSNNLPVTGIVNYETFISILERYKARMLTEIPNTYFISQSLFPIKIGSLGSAVEHINILLKNILEEYNIDLKVPYGSYYGYDTTNAINTVSSIFNISATDGVTPELYNRMLIENKAIAIKKSFK